MNHSEKTISLFHTAIDNKDSAFLQELCKHFGMITSLRTEIWKIILDIQPMKLPKPLELKITESDVPPIVNKLISVINQSKRNELIKDSFTIATALIKPKTSPNYIPTVIISLIFYYLYPNESIEFRLGGVHSFLKKFQPFYHTLYPSVQKGLYCLMHILLQYHDPEVCHYLDSFRVEPILYTNRYFYGACYPTGETINDVLVLWDAFVLNNNVYLGFYAVVSYLIEIRNEILKEKKKDELITMIKTKRIDNERMRIVICRALALEQRTMTSFKLLLKSCFKNDQMFQNWFNNSLGSTLALPLQINTLVDDINNGMKVLFVDCRPFEMYKGGYIRNAINFDFTMKENEKYLNEFYQRKEIVSLFTKTDYTHIVIYGLGDVGKSNNQQTPSYSDLTMMLLDFMKHGMKRVGVLLSGYTAYHRLAMNRTPGFEITQHVTQSCPICTPPEFAKISMKFSEGKRKISEKATNWFSSISSSFSSSKQSTRSVSPKTQMNKQQNVKQNQPQMQQPQQIQINQPKQQPMTTSTVPQTTNKQPQNVFDFLSPQETSPYTPTQPKQQPQQTPNLLDLLNAPSQPNQTNQSTQPSNQQKKTTNFLFEVEQDSEDEEDITTVQQEPLIDMAELTNNQIQTQQMNEPTQSSIKLTFEEEYNDEDDINEEDSNYFDELMKESPHFEGGYALYNGSPVSNWRKCIAILSSVDMLIVDKSTDDGEMDLLDEITYFDIKNFESQPNGVYLIECEDKKVMLKFVNGDEFFTELNNKMNE